MPPYNMASWVQVKEHLPLSCMQLSSGYLFCDAWHYTPPVRPDHCTWNLTPPALPDQIGLERSRLIELEEKANGLQGKIGTQRKAMGGINAAREANIQVLLQTKTQL